MKLKTDYEKRKTVEAARSILAMFGDPCAYTDSNFRVVFRAFRGCKNIRKAISGFCVSAKEAEYAFKQLSIAMQYLSDNGDK